jgi:hypothetical protein
MTVNSRAHDERARLSPMGGEVFFPASSSQRAARSLAPAALQEMQE